MGLVKRRVGVWADLMGLDMGWFDWVGRGIVVQRKFGCKYWINAMVLHVMRVVCMMCVFGKLRFGTQWVEGDSVMWFCLDNEHELIIMYGNVGVWIVWGIVVVIWWVWWCVGVWLWCVGERWGDGVSYCWISSIWRRWNCKSCSSGPRK